MKSRILLLGDVLSTLYLKLSLISSRKTLCNGEHLQSNTTYISTLKFYELWIYTQKLRTLYHYENYIKLAQSSSKRTAYMFTLWDINNKSLNNQDVYFIHAPK